MPRQKPGRILLLDDNVNDVPAVKVPGLSQELLFPVVMVARQKLKTPVEPAQRLPRRLGPNRPPGKGPRRLLDVILRIMPNAHTEQLQQLPTPVFVDGAVVVAVVVQPVNHRRVLRQLHQQVGKSSQPLPAEHPDLRRQFRRVVHLRVPGGEKLMPEQRHLFLQRPTGVNHPIDPLRLRRHRRQRTLKVREIADEFILIHSRLRPRVQQLLHRSRVTHRSPPLQLRPRRPETGPPHQMRHQSNIRLTGHKSLLLPDCPDLPLL